MPVVHGTAHVGVAAICRDVPQRQILREAHAPLLHTLRWGHVRVLPARLRGSRWCAAKSGLGSIPKPPRCDHKVSTFLEKSALRNCHPKYLVLVLARYSSTPWYPARLRGDLSLGDGRRLAARGEHRWAMLGCGTRLIERAGIHAVARRGAALAAAVWELDDGFREGHVTWQFGGSRIVFRPTPESTSLCFD